MDTQSTNVVAYCSIILSVLTIVVGAINHKRVRSHCCGSSVEASIDIENTTPPTQPKV